MAEVKLLPCPFCGGRPYLRRAMQSEWRINCYSRCHARPSVFGALMTTAIRRWNKRVQVKEDK